MLSSRRWSTAHPSGMATVRQPLITYNIHYCHIFATQHGVLLEHIPPLSIICPLSSFSLFTIMNIKNVASIDEPP